MFGRKKKKIKLNTNDKAIAFVLNFPSKEVFIDISVVRDFKQMSEVDAKELQIKKLMRELSAEFNDDSEMMRPIVAFSSMTQRGLETTKNNLLKAEVVIYMDEMINSLEEMNQPLLEKYVSEID